MKKEFDRELLVKEASRAMMKAYAPYSGYFVGAALLTAEGKIYTGCNIENSAYSPTNCAERTAFFKAVSDGVKEFSAIAISGGPEDGELQYCPPCGVCRQVMTEFCDLKEFRVVLYDGVNIADYALGELLPLSFGKADMEI